MKKLNKQIGMRDVSSGSAVRDERRALLNDLVAPSGHARPNGKSERIYSCQSESKKIDHAADHQPYEDRNSVRGLSLGTGQFTEFL